MSDKDPAAFLVEGGGYQYVSLLREDAEASVRHEGGFLVPLYRQSPPRITKKERKAIEFAAKHFGAFKNQAATIRGLMARLS